MSLPRFKPDTFCIQARNTTILATILEALLLYMSFPCTQYILSLALRKVLLYDKGTSIVL